MARRVTLPSADELFRATEDAPDGVAVPGSDPSSGSRRASVHAVPDPRAPQVLEASGEAAVDPAIEAAAGASGRVRHDEKVTVYVTADELLAIERARLTLRGDHGLAVDRGRLVREAIHLALAGLAGDGADSALVRRLAEQA